MSVGMPSGLGRACPVCGTVQESPGSTVCEQCGADLTRPHLVKTQPRRPAIQFGRLLNIPAQLLRGIVGLVRVLLYQIQRLVLFAVRLAVLVLVIGALVVGLTLVPAVRARVPAAKDVNTTAMQWLRRAQDWAGNYLPVLKPAPAARSSRPAAPAATPTPKPAAAKPVVTQPLTITSTPSGATVRLNTRSVGKTPLTLKVAAGTYKVTISRTGYVTTTRTVIVKQGKASSVVVILPAVRQ